MSDTPLAIKRSAAARADLLDIWLYIADQDANAADRVLGEIERIIRLIATHPKMGRERHEILPNLRGFGILSWIVFYRVEADCIDVIRVVHGARDLDDIEF